MAPRTKRGRSGRKGQSVTKSNLRSALYGSRLRPKNDPSSTSLVPWNSLTVVSNTATAATAPTTTFFSSATLDLAIRNQLGLPTSETSVELAFRLKAVRLWSIQSSTPVMPTVTMAPCDLVESSGTTQSTAVLRKWLEDRGTPVRPATVGYSWPVADVDRVFRSTQDEVALFVLSLQTVSQQYLVHFDLLWRPYPASFTSAMTRLALTAP